MSTVILFLLLLSLFVSSCECRIQLPTKSNLEGIRKEFMHTNTIETTPAQDDVLNQAKKVDVIQELVSSGFKALRLLCHGSPKGFNLKLKVMRSSNRHKLLGYESKWKESRTINEELVAMDYSGAEKGPSVHNR